MIPYLCGGLIGLGAFFVLCDLLKLPDHKVERAFLNTAKRQTNQCAKFDLALQRLATVLAHYIKLNDYRRAQMTSDLQTAGIHISPEQYMANAIIKALLCAMLAIPLLYLFPLLVPVVLLFSIAIYTKQLDRVRQKIKQHRADIEFELPRFVFYIEKTLLHSRDLLTMMETYTQRADPAFKQELAITTSDMRAGNYEAALMRMESRVGSALLSDVVLGLVSVLRGENTTVHWQMLSLKFADVSRNQLKASANKVPGRVRRLSMLLLFCFILLYMVVIVSVILSSLGAMFG